MLLQNELVRRVTGRGAGKFSNWLELSRAPAHENDMSAEPQRL